jgi:4-hydroxythreonine-4-phosphate dehydrogenase
MTRLPRLAVTVGDPSGVGPEVVVKALAEPAVRKAFLPIIVGDLESLRSTAESCDIDLEFTESGQVSDMSSARVPVLDIGMTGPPPTPGLVSPAGGEAAWLAIEAAVTLCAEGAADALVTAPINKMALEQAGRGHHGHTEILQHLTGSPWALTLFVLGELRILFFSRHLSLRQAIDAVKADAICQTLERFSKVAPQLGLSSPRIAVGALNPHAGEGGLFGREEIDEIAPGVEAARARGIDVTGPIPADTVFHLARQGAYDVVLSLYHDQAAGVPKSIDFHRTVSITLGLPFLRFSVDHGTALDIAGQNRADASNMVHTMLTAAEVVGAVQKRSS